MTKQEIAAAVKLLKEQARLQQEFSNDYKAYLDGLKKANAYKKELNRLSEIEKKLVIEVNQAASGSQAKIDAQKKLDLLRDQTKELKKQADILGLALKDANKSKMLLAKGGAMAFKSLGKIPGMFKSIYGEIKGLGLFEMDKAVKKTALSMGVLSKENLSFTNNLRESSLYTNNMGISLEELAKMQADYSDELGRSVVLSEGSLKAMSEMAAATGLGAEGTSKLASDMDAIGYSAERTRDFMNDAMNKSSKMGLNASKVVKNIQQNIKMLNKYNFKGGAKGLAKMAETTTKLGVDMNFAANMAEKLFDIEGAVDMSAQLQVMGGEWAKLADPFKLMYMARNDMEGLTAALGEAAKSAVHFNEKSGEFEISGLEMHRLRKIAEQTGVAYDDLAEAGRRAAKLSKIQSMVNFSVTGDKELAEYITNKAEFKDGKATIMVNGKPKLLKTLDAADKNILKNQVKEEQNLAERAKQAQTFDESLTNLINMMKVTMLPIIDGINDVLKPLVQDLFNNDDFKNELKELGKDIGSFIKSGAELVKGIVDWSVKYLGPKGVLATVLGYKALGWLIDKATWFSNGLLLAQGFNMGTMGGGLTKILGGLTKAVNVLGVSIAGWAIGKGLGGKTSEAFGNKSTEEGDKASMWTAGGAALAGAAIGSLFGGVGAVPGYIIGAGIGALAGGFGGKVIGDAMNQPTHDGLFEMGRNYGSDFSKGNAIVQNGTVTPIDNKDKLELLASKKNGIIDNYRKSKVEKPQIIKHIFDDININGTLMLSIPGGGNIPVDMTKDPTFIRNLTSMIHAETEKTINGGKN